MIKYFYIAFILCLTSVSYSQDISISDYLGELNIKLAVIDEKRLERGVNTLNEAVLIEYEALAILNSMDDVEKTDGESKRYRKMLKKFVSASSTFQEGHELIYTVFNSNCDKFRIEMKKLNHYASGMNKAKYYEHKGERTIKRANNIREVLFEADKPEWIQYKMHEALELEKFAIRDKGRSLQIYQDFPVEYNYGWDNDVTLDELAKFYYNPVIKLPPEEVFRNIPEEEKKEPEDGIVEFRVQIAAHTVQLENSYIKTFYTEEEEVKEVHEGAWFKYQLGSFDNFKDANILRIKSRVPRAFVVAYQKDKKITIKKALAILQENQ